MKDGKSYLQMNFSLRNFIEIRVLIRIPAAVFVDKSTMSTNGITAAPPEAEIQRSKKPHM